MMYDMKAELEKLWILIERQSRRVHEWPQQQIASSILHSSDSPYVAVDRELGLESNGDRSNPMMDDMQQQLHDLQPLIERQSEWGKPCTYSSQSKDQILHQVLHSRCSNEFLAGQGLNSISSLLIFPSFVKDTLPMFDGNEDVKVWIDACDLFIEKYKISEANKVFLATSYLRGSAHMWYWEHKQVLSHMSWHEFKSVLSSRFITLHSQLRDYSSSPSIYEKAMDIFTAEKCERYTAGQKLECNDHSIDHGEIEILGGENLNDNPSLIPCEKVTVLRNEDKTYYEMSLTSETLNQEVWVMRATDVLNSGCDGRDVQGTCLRHLNSMHQEFCNA